MKKTKQKWSVWAIRDINKYIVPPWNNDVCFLKFHYNLICMTTINNVKLCGAKMKLNHIKWFFNENWRRVSYSRELTHHKLFVTKLAEKSTCCAITLIVFQVYQVIWSNFITVIPQSHWPLNSHSLKNTNIW